MRQRALAAMLLALPWAAFGQEAAAGAPVPGKPVAESLAQQPEEGPAAALAYEALHRGADSGKGGGFSEEGRYSATPVSFYDTGNGDPIAANIVAMSETLWTPDQLIADFKANKKGAETSILVVIKTEFCCTNKFRPCAVVTASLEKYATPELKKFRMYGAWIKNPKALRKGQDPAKKAAWDAQVADEYGFEQGPGATIALIDPVSGRIVRTDAVKMELYMEPFLKNKGSAPKLEAGLKKFLAERP